MECEVKDCNSKAQYFMYHINENLSKDWIKVCPKCEEKIGDRNLMLQGYNKYSLPLEGNNGLGK